MIRVLLVDDEEPIRRGLRTIFESIPGFIVTGQAGNGAEALDLLERGIADIAVVDIRMPIMDGLELIHAIHRQGMEIPCVIMSGYDDYAYMRDAIRSGVYDYLLKPIDRLEFAQCMLRIQKTRTGEVDADEDASVLIRRVQSIIEDRMYRSISLQSIAEELHYSYNHLSYAFKKETGCSFSEYLTRKRLDHARYLLRHSRLKIYEIASDCGYVDTKYFINLFHREEGLTPAQYRNQHNRPETP